MRKALQYVVLDLYQTAPAKVVEIAGVPGGEEGTPFLLCIGASPEALRARQNAFRDAEVVSVESLPTALAQVGERVPDVPWVVFDAPTVKTNLLALGSGEDPEGLAPVAWWDLREVASFLLPTVDTSLPTLGAALGLSWGEQPGFPPGLRRARAMGQAFQRLTARLGTWPRPLVQSIGSLLQRARHPLATLFAWAAEQTPEPEQALSVESFLRARLRELTPAVGELPEPPSPQPLEVNSLQAHFRPEGNFARHHPEYEYRPGQVEMARAVTEAFNQGEVLLVEAGTGTGKSLAYLVPALYWAVNNQQRVVISTNTKNLQDQLFYKDLPFLRETLDLDFRAEVVKGRQNYLCVEKLLLAYEDAPFLLEEEQAFFVAYLLAWAWQTETGDLEELSDWLCQQHPRLRPFAAELASDSESCLSPGRRGHPCFAEVARRRAVLADVLIVNHALTLANAVTNVLPPFAYLILDEAHNLEDIATNTFGHELARRDIARQLFLLRGGRRRGLLARIQRDLEGLSSTAAEEIQERLAQVEYLLPEVEDRLQEFTEQLALAVMAQEQLSLPELQMVQRLRLTERLWQGSIGASLLVAQENLLSGLREMSRSLTQLMLVLTGYTEELPQGARLSIELEATRNDWTALSEEFELLLKLDEPAFVYWLELVFHRDRLEWKFHAAPIDVGSQLAEYVYSQMHTLVMTSATMTVNGQFAYFRERLGLDEVASRVRELQVPSSFNYQEQVLLGVPTDLPLPTEATFDEAVGRALTQLVTMIQGRTLVLFTSHLSMRRVFEQIAPAAAEAGVEVLCQGISGARHTLAERLRRQSSTVVLGTRSFWEGIDVPGEALQCVVIVKLPFAVPTDPLVQARCEYLEAQGIDSRLHYYEPQAIIQFKQGFGRLIRSATDRGVVLVFDRRILMKSYGPRFFRSVPGYTLVRGPWQEVLAETRWWLAGERS